MPAINSNFSLKHYCSYIAMIVCALLATITAQAVEPQEEDETPLTLEDYVDGMEAFDGLFTLYQDPETGSLSMAIHQSQLNTEFLYYAFIEDGVADAFNQRGMPVTEYVIEIKQYFDRIDFVKKNTSFYIDEKSTLSNGGYANISDSVLASIYVEATSESGEIVLINADELFQTEKLAQITFNLDPDSPAYTQFDIGQLNLDKSSYTHIGVYPDNMNIRSAYVYTNEKPYVYGSAALADARANTINVQHSFVKMPDNDFEPRFDDQRVGFFTKQVSDLTSFELNPYRDLITRWHLVKKYPDKPISEPVEPIVWWIENTVPYEYREIMKAGVLAWNSAFEKSGFKNALVVKIQPDDARWSADDIRYNVIRYSNSPGIGWAFGPSYINPRTGQILGGDVMFEQSFISGYGFRGDVLANPDAFFDHVSLQDNRSLSKHPKHCRKGYQMQEMFDFGRIALTATNASVSEKRKIIEQMLMELMLHEVGHVLGLMHNMKASNLHSLKDALNPAVTKGITTSSVMDYTALLIAKPGELQGDFFTTAPGPYDDWAIQFGYDPNLVGDKRKQHLARSTERALMFGNDADDMRSPGIGIDPLVNIWDMTSDNIAYARYQMELANEIIPLLRNRIGKEGESWLKLRLAVERAIFHKARNASVVASYIGGIEVNRYNQGQSSNLAPYTPIDLKTQQRAMAVLAEHIFAPAAFSIPDDILQHIAIQRRGFDHYGTTEDPKLIEMIGGIQVETLERVMHPVVLARLTDTQMYGNKYSVNQMMTELTAAIFKQDIKNLVNPIRMNLQIAYTDMLIGSFKNTDYDNISKAVMFSQLKSIERIVEKGKTNDEATSPHREYLAYLITSSLDDD